MARVTMTDGGADGVGGDADAAVFLGAVAGSDHGLGACVGADGGVR